MLTTKKALCNSVRTAIVTEPARKKNYKGKVHAASEFFFFFFVCAKSAKPKFSVHDTPKTVLGIRTVT